MESGTDNMGCYRELLNKELEKRRMARDNFRCFLGFVMPSYSRQWFHTYIADKCQSLVEGTLGKSGLMLFVPPQHGKQLSDSTLVPTPNGFVRHGDLKEGDFVFGMDGKRVKVLAVSPKTRSEYIVTFSDGQEIECHGNHEWTVYDRSCKKERTVETRYMAGQKLYSGTLGKRGCHYRFLVPPSVCVDFERRDVEIDPYTLGAWLGDGKSSAPQITIGNGDREIVGKIPYRHTSHWIQESTGVEYYYYGSQLNLSCYDLANNKHIPQDYIFNSVECRKQLIAGLIDTDGYVYQKNGRVTISNTNKGIIDDAALILRSLGQNAVVASFAPKTSSSGIEGKQTVYQLCFNPTTDFPTAVPRKRISRTVPNKRRSIVSIGRKEGLGFGNCIQVEGGIYLVGETFIPTHNSEIVSRKFPAWVLGVNPSAKIVGASYSAYLAQQFSRSIQRTIDDDLFKAVFPGTSLNSKNVSTDSKRGVLRNVDIFETVGYGGFYRAVGVGGGLTGTAVDLGIIDDPIKDAMQANSPTYRERVWDWYVNVFLTRLHNDSRKLIIMTRWHEDDIAGRLLELEPDKWEVVSIPAIREDMSLEADPRQIGEALWEERHSLESLLEMEQRSPRTFAALYQQRPTIEGGNIIKRDWFKHIKTADFNRIYDGEPVVFFLDTAFTEKTCNDPTGIIATTKIGGDLYITHAERLLLKFPDLIRFIPSYVHAHGYSRRSSIRIEPKANGISVVDQLKEVTELNVVQTPSPKDSKETRLYAASPTVESGRVVLVDGAWNEGFIDEVCGFPSKPHDEFVDLLGYAIDYHIANPFKPIDKARTARKVY